MTRTESANDPQALRRRAKRLLAGACFFAALFLFVLIGVITLLNSNSKEVARLTAAGAPAKEIDRLKVNTPALLNVGSFGDAISLVGFVVCFVKWRSVVLRRRREEQGLPPTASP